MVWYIEHYFFKKRSWTHLWYFCGSHRNQGDLILSFQSKVPSAFLLSSSFLFGSLCSCFPWGAFLYGNQSVTPELCFLLFTLQIPRKTKPVALQRTWRGLKGSKTEWAHVAGGLERPWENHSSIRKYPHELLYSFLCFTSAKANYTLCW